MRDRIIAFIVFVVLGPCLIYLGSQQLGSAIKIDRSEIMLIKIVDSKAKRIKDSYWAAKIQYILVDDGDDLLKDIKRKHQSFNHISREKANALLDTYLIGRVLEVHSLRGQTAVFDEELEDDYLYGIIKLLSGISMLVLGVCIIFPNCPFKVDFV